MIAAKFAMRGEDQRLDDIAADLAGDVGGRGQAQHLRGEGRIGRAVLAQEQVERTGDLAGARRQGGAIGTRAPSGDERAHRDALQGLPAIDRNRYRR